MVGMVKWAANGSCMMFFCAGGLWYVITKINKKIHAQIKRKISKYDQNQYKEEKTDRP